MPQVHCLKIFGDVQGVNLRYNVFEYTQKSKLKGWVRNESDGSAFCCIDGDDKEINRLIDWLKARYKISTIERDKMFIDAEYNKFEIRY